MNEEILNEFESLFEISEAPENIIKDFNMIKYYIDKLQQENKQLKDRIDKAIEYIINKKYWDGINNYRLSNVDELLEILKGSDNND